MNKYGNRKVILDGQKFDSKHEAQRWQELKLMERAGLIEGLVRQFPIKLLPAQKDERGKVIERPVRYVADFVYTEKNTGRTVVEDAKGMKTKDYILKRKMALYFHGIRIKEV